MGWEDALGVPKTTPVDDASRDDDERPQAWTTALGTDAKANAGPVLDAADSLSRRSAATPDPPRRVRRRRRSSRWRRERNESNKRLDVQGLRAVAVLAVVVNHLTGHPQGGFVGVDVFFVISGYLITSLLLREGNRTGTISLIGFYKRRIRRLFPAALTVTVATVVAGYFIFLPSRAKEIRTDGIWATFFGANWRQVQVGTDYFKAIGPVSPLQHYWSLSVEEQFYFVWPLVLLLVYILCRRLFGDRRNATITTGAIGALALTIPSLIYAWHQTNTAPVVAYFSTFTRAWELGLGATLAVLTPFMRGTRWTLTALSWLGLALIGVSLFTVTAGNIPFPGVVVPCVGSALCLVAWTQHARAANFLLTNVVSVYIGDISYSIYLVHFPVIIFAKALLPDRSVMFYLSISALIVGLSSLLYHAIENPIRESNWLLPRGSERRQRSPYWNYGQLAGAGFSVLALAMYMLFVGSPSTANPYAARILADQNVSVAPPPSTSSLSAVAPGAPPTLGALQTELKQALLATSWPDLHPPFGSEQSIGGPGCAISPLPASECTWGNPTAAHTVYLVGDSTSVAYTNAFLTIIKVLPDWKVRLAAGDGCPFTDHPVAKADGNANSATCPTRNEQVVQEINSVHPDLVVVTSGQGDSSITDPETAQVEKIKDAAKLIVVLPAPPHLKDPLECFTTVSRPSDCVTPLPAEYAGWLANERAVATAVGGKFIDPTAWYCADALCPAFASDIPMMRDGIHQTTNYSAHIALVVLAAFRGCGCLPPG